MKKALALILTLIMVLGLMPAAMAATAPASQQQIGNYYKADQSSEGKLEDTPSQNASEWVYNGENRQVGVRKTISGTDEENVFDIKLEVQTKQDLKQISSANEKAAVVLVMDVSGSMRGNLQGAMKAAQDFINSFANVSNAENRKVAIVKFSGSKNWENETTIDGARTVQGWINASSIKKEDGSLCDALNGLEANGGTNIHAGLLLAKNLLGTIDNDYSKNIVLFTDGEPTYHVTESEVQSTSTEVICKTDSKNTIGGNGEETYHNDHHSVETTVGKIKEAGITPYAIYLGNKNIKCNTLNEWGSCIIDLHRYKSEYNPFFPADYKISAWLKDAGFTAYSATSADDLSKIFTSIAEFITISAQAWQVTDPMGAMVDFVEFQDTNYENKQASYDESNKQITWKLIGDITREESGDEGNKIYTYQLNYRIKLNTLRDGFKAGDFFATNGVTSLSYFIHEGSEPVENPQLSYAYFNVPSVKGFAGDLTFTKFDANNEPLAGAAFKITANDDPNWSMDGTPYADGTSFTFTGIPSGHTYTLTETKTPEGYQGLDATYTVEVAYGVAVLKKGADTVTAIVNTPKETPTGSLTITKEFEFEGEATEARPNSITFTVQQIVQEGEPGHSETVTLTPNDSWEKTINNVPVGEYTVTEGDANIDGYTYTPVQNPTGNITVAATGTAAVTFTNTYKKLSPDTNEITFNVSKTVEQKGNVAPGTNTFNFEFTIFTEGIEDAAINNSDYIVTIGGNTITPDVTGKYGFSITVNGATTQTVQVKVQGETAKIDNIAGLKVSETGTAPEYWTYDNKEAKSAQAGDSVTFTNTYTKMQDNTGSLTVKKTVSGGGASYNKEFTFTVTLTQNKDPLSGEVGGVTFTDGVATFTLKHNQEKSITGIPAGYTYTVTENADGYTQSITSGSATGTIKKGETATVTFNNYKSGGDHYYPTPDPVPPIVIPPNTGDMTIWQSILHFLGIR